ncbi:SDR family NAD(P)-dependent oxidoreductase [Synechococcus sp. AH-601-L23]|nr:SDR family NAD(P)-dependent oxidoreductase [Synechococcus sp. AH-601-L23]
MVDLSSNRSSISLSLAQHCQAFNGAQTSTLHLVLPELALRVVPFGDEKKFVDDVIDGLWHVFSTVREWHQKLQDTKARILLWAWPGEFTDRPDFPEAEISSAVKTSDDISLLPALSGLLRSMALELDRPIVLMTTDPVFEPEDLLHVTAFLDQGDVKLGDYVLSAHRLSTHEPQMVTHAAPVDRSHHQPFKGHTLSLGGARGIVAEMLSRLTNNHSHLSVVGRTKSEPLDPELLGLDSPDLMRALMRRHRQHGDDQPITPRLLQQQVERLRSQASLEQHLLRLRQGMNAFDYHAVDLSDTNQCAELLGLESMRDVNILVSGAGIIQDQSCLKKTKESFDAVIRTKVAPLSVLLCRGLPTNLKSWISFSSIASKSGNPGQADYAAANEFLNTVVHWFSRRHPEIRMRTINWGPWQGSGMANEDVLQSFRSRGLEGIEAETAASMMRQLFSSDWTPVEVSALLLQQEVEYSLLQQKLLVASSLMWRSHLLPNQDSSVNKELHLVFHEDIPYLQGHQKQHRSVVPAALFLCLAADFAASLHCSSQDILYVDLYVFNGIIVPRNSLISTRVQYNLDKNDASGKFKVLNSSAARPHYEVKWRWEKKLSIVPSWNWFPTPDSQFLECDLHDVYKKCLFHSGVMARLSDRILIDRKTNIAWSKAQSSCESEQLGIEQISTHNLPYRDMPLIDSLLQLLLVQTIETYQYALLPQELSFMFLGEIPENEELSLTCKIENIQGSCLTATGACCDSKQNILFVMNISKFTLSEELLDFPPGISRSLINLP